MINESSLKIKGLEEENNENEKINEVAIVKSSDEWLNEMINAEKEPIKKIKEILKEKDIVGIKVEKKSQDDKIINYNVPLIKENNPNKNIIISPTHSEENLDIKNNESVSNHIEDKAEKMQEDLKIEEKRSDKMQVQASRSNLEVDEVIKFQKDDKMKDEDFLPYNKLKEFEKKLDIEKDIYIEKPYNIYEGTYYIFFKIKNLPEHLVILFNLILFIFSTSAYFSLQKLLNQEITIFKDK
jgi:hypothetical protein